jgi:hypothetical protein
VRTLSTFIRVALCAVLFASAAWAQTRPTVIDHPLELKGSFTPSQRAQLRGELRELLSARKGVLSPASTGWTMAVRGLERPDCETSDACLQRLAVLGGCVYGLFAQIEANAARTEVRAIGRVVGPRGVAAQSEVKLKFRRATSALPRAARAALTQLLDTLALEKLPLGVMSASAASATSAVPPPAVPPVVPAVAPAPVAAPAPAAAPVVVPASALGGFAPIPKSSGNELDGIPAPPLVAVTDAPFAIEKPAPAPRRSPALRGLGIAAIGTAAAAGGVALAFGVSAMQDQQKLPTDGRFDDGAQVQQQVNIDRKATVALGLGIGAAALAVTGGILLIASVPPKTPAVAVMPTNGGASLAVSGRF